MTWQRLKRDLIMLPVSLAGIGLLFAIRGCV